ncbi:MAG: hypothetical protein Q9227_002905 [Pyrenula ochraceoflavens]
MTAPLLMKEYKELQKEKWVNIEMQDDDVFNWQVALMVVNPDSLYYGGYFKATMSFPKDYPYQPPTFRFTKPLYHPNIYEDGRLCISILHQPGDDIMSGEAAGERWSPAQRVETVLISIMSLLDDAEVNSPANVDAGVMLRTKPKEYKKRVLEDVEASKKDIPEGFVMPTHESTKPAVLKEPDDDFWADSDMDEDTFGDSDEEMGAEDDFGEDADESPSDDDDDDGDDISDD